jgi:osmotically-inducible protein OsmY
MARHSPLLDRVRLRLQHSPRGDLLRSGMSVFLENGDLVLEGEVADIADKKTALLQAAMVAGVGPIIDRLHVRPSARRPDADILRDVSRLLDAEVALSDCLVQGTACGNHSRTRVLCPEGWQGDIEIRVEDGVVTLDGDVPSLAQKCLASILAWSVPGCRDVIDGLGVDATDDDSDTAMTEAIRRAIERLSPPGGAPSLTVRVTGGVVTLSGEVTSWDEARAIDRLVWGMFGVAEVRDQLALPAAPGAVDSLPSP